MVFPEFMKVQFLNKYTGMKKQEIAKTRKTIRIKFCFWYVALTKQKIISYKEQLQMKKKENIN